MGSFTQQDPIGFAGGLNLYGYANGDPVNFSDPFGLCPVCPFLYGAAAGAAGGVAEGYLVTKALGGDYSAGSLVVDGLLGAVGGVAATFGHLRRLGRLGARADNVAGAIDPNKLHHIFDKPGRNLGSLVDTFGSQEDAFRAIQGAAQAAVDAGDVALDSRGVFKHVVRVGEESLTVEGRVIDGVTRIGTAYR